MWLPYPAEAWLAGEEVTLCHFLFKYPQTGIFGSLSPHMVKENLSRQEKVKSFLPCSSLTTNDPFGKFDALSPKAEPGGSGGEETGQQTA